MICNSCRGTRSRLTDESSNKKDDTEHIKLIKIIFFSLIGIVCVRYDVNLIIFLIFIGITGCFDDVKEDTWLFLLFLLFFLVFSPIFRLILRSLTEKQDPPKKGLQSLPLLPLPTTTNKSIHE